MAYRFIGALSKVFDVVVRGTSVSICGMVLIMDLPSPFTILLVRDDNLECSGLVCGKVGNSTTLHALDAMALVIHPGQN